METALPVGRRKRFKGVLQGIKNETIALAMPEGNVEITFSNIRTAKLIPAFIAGSGHKPGKKKKK
jgi:ribosome maturation factor RimP